MSSSSASPNPSSSSSSSAPPQPGHVLSPPLAPHPLLSPSDLVVLGAEATSACVVLDGGKGKKYDLEAASPPLSVPGMSKFRWTQPLGHSGGWLSFFGGRNKAGVSGGPVKIRVQVADEDGDPLIDEVIKIPADIADDGVLAAGGATLLLHCASDEIYFDLLRAYMAGGIGTTCTARTYAGTFIVGRGGAVGGRDVVRLVDDRDSFNTLFKYEEPFRMWALVAGRWPTSSAEGLDLAEAVASMLSSAVGAKSLADMIGKPSASALDRARKTSPRPHVYLTVQFLLNGCSVAGLEALSVEELRNLSVTDVQKVIAAVGDKTNVQQGESSLVLKARDVLWGKARPAPFTVSPSSAQFSDFVFLLFENSPRSVRQQVEELCMRKFVAPGKAFLSKRPRTSSGGSSERGSDICSFVSALADACTSCAGAGPQEDFLAILDSVVGQATNFRLDDPVRVGQLIAGSPLLCRSSTILELVLGANMDGCIAEGRMSQTSFERGWFLDLETASIFRVAVEKELDAVMARIEDSANVGRGDGAGFLSASDEEEDGGRGPEAKRPRLDTGEDVEMSDVVGGGARDGVDVAGARRRLLDQQRCLLEFFLAAAKHFRRLKKKESARHVAVFGLAADGKTALSSEKSPVCFVDNAKKPIAGGIVVLEVGLRTDGAYRSVGGEDDVGTGGWIFLSVKFQLGSRHPVNGMFWHDPHFYF